MSDPHPLMMLMIGNNSFLGGAEEVEKEIMPIQAQRDFNTGDAAVLAMANTPLEHEFTVVKAVDPSKHAETWPDWEDRAGPMKSYVLCEIFSTHDPVPHLGWVPRIKVMPISKYRYRQARKWLHDGFPEELPEWASKAYMKYAEELADQAPSIVPRAAVCPWCQSTEIELLVSQREEFKSKVGVLKIDGKDLYVPVNDPEHNHNHVARLHCANCDAFADLDEEEWDVRR